MRDPRATPEYRPGDDPGEFYRLSFDRRARLLAWIAANFEPAPRSLSGATSYSVKHELQRAPGGFYVVNGAFKGALVALGFEIPDRAALNWQFRARRRPMTGRGSTEQQRAYSGPAARFHALAYHLRPVTTSRPARRGPDPGVAMPGSGPPLLREGDNAARGARGVEPGAPCGKDDY